MIKEVKELQKKKKWHEQNCSFCLLAEFKYQFNWRLNGNYHYKFNLLWLNLRTNVSIAAEELIFLRIVLKKYETGRKSNIFNSQLSPSCIQTVELAKK